MGLTNLDRLEHMLEAAQRAQRMAHGESRQSLENDIKLALALVKCIEIIGEAAAKLPREYREQNSEMPWSKMIGMRNVLIHLYFTIDYDLVWDAVTNDLPLLITQLEELIASESKDA